MLLSLVALTTWLGQGHVPTLREAASKAHLEIGSAAAPAFLSEPDYADILGKEFSVLEPENAMKFGPIHPRPGNEPSSYDFADADKLVAFAEAHKMKVRGHTLVWQNQIAPWVRGSGTTPSQLSADLHNHIATVVGRYRGKVFAWDVVNEAFKDDGTLRSTPWYDRPGIGFAGEGTRFIEQAFRWAHEADRRAKLYYNDFGAETIGAKSDGIYAMAKDFKAHGVPIDGIGFQMHCDLRYPNDHALASLEKNMKRFADLGLDLAVTELDIRLADSGPESLAKQADLYRKIVEICRRQPRCKLLQIWGFTDKHSWIPSVYRGQGWALLFDENYKGKPAYDAVLGALTAR